ncbi:MAG: endonuclease/exonuclease/phosphatase family protein, partial [Hyphomicrobiaceae bacterium]|nr:endonuclease/exonuclease/phosphatase family protein [Hyphomicrobiaceae bacterium]
MKIATWNINGIKARLGQLLYWLKKSDPDVTCLQEIKCLDELFPITAFVDAGYHIETHGQRGFNGVALISKFPLTDVVRGLPGDNMDQQARYIEAVATHPNAKFRVASIYLPNGNPTGTAKFSYKIAWIKRLEDHAKRLLELEESTILAGDFNIIPE